MADINAARAAVAAAQASKEDLLRRAVEGEPITEAELAAADAECERCARIEELEDAKARGLKLKAEAAEIASLKVRAASLELAFHSAIDQRIAAASAVDDAIAVLQEAIEGFHKAGWGVNAAQAALLQHDTEVNSHLLPGNATLAAMPHANRPLALKPNGGQPLPVIQVQHELFHIAGVGFAQKRQTVHSLEAYERAAHRRPFVKVDAA